VDFPIKMVDLSIVFCRFTRPGHHEITRFFAEDFRPGLCGTGRLLLDFWWALESELVFNGYPAW
jgi:hypothetical protein